MKTESVQIVDRGKGPQFSHCRITIQDLVQYFRSGDSHEEILRWMPVLTASDLILAAEYYREHKAELDDRDRKIDEYRERESEKQRQRFPFLNGTIEERRARMRAIIQERKKGTDGATPSG